MKIHECMRVVLLVLIFSCPFVFAKAQTTRDVGANPPAPVYQSHKKSGFSFAKLFKGKNKIKKPYEEQKDFERRMRAVARQKSKEARMAGKPEYANKFYFGHKRKPKKRAAGKKKFCKICQFAH